MLPLKRFFTRRTLGYLLILCGGILLIYFGIRSVSSYREATYAREQGLLDGTADVSAIHGWMTMRYIAVAYAVPLEYLYAALEIPFDERDSNNTLGSLNRRYNLGAPETEGGTLPIIQTMRQAITDYRANPVATGLDDIRPWMSLSYIANSTGISTDDLLAALNLPENTTAEIENLPQRPLGNLSDQLSYPGGPRQLEEDLANFLGIEQRNHPNRPDRQEGNPHDTNQ